MIHERVKIPVESEHNAERFYEALNDVVSTLVVIIFCDFINVENEFSEIHIVKHHSNIRAEN